MFIVKTSCHFNAAHYLEEPYEGVCTQLHGHTWKVEVKMKTRNLNECGMVADFKKIKDIVNQLDHRLINDFIKQPTAENIAKMIFLRITDEIFKPEYVRVWESEASYAEYSESE